ncbi:MAG TPA: hypothetical protein VK835_12660 [Bacteroidia bacterium]|nr:hypothetical protein [Bacteroidia bacterium]
MLHKITFLLLLVFAGIKTFSQDTLRANPFLANNFAIIEISKNGSFDNESTTIHFDDGKTADIANKVYGTNTDLPVTQKALQCIKYMKARNYNLISSTVSTASANHPAWITYYDYQYIFEKKEK